LPRHPGRDYPEISDASETTDERGYKIKKGNSEKKEGKRGSY
jgi:hypothetical protein